VSNRITLFWSFRSPYSYIALPRVIAVSERLDAPLEVRIVHPAALRNPEYFRSMNPLARRYFMLASARAAAFQGMSFRRPVPDPIAQDPVTLTFSPDQPLARRLGRLGVAAAQRGHEVPFCLEVSRLLWDGQVEGWDKGDHLAHAAARADLDLGELEAAIAADPDAREEILAQNDSALREASHWGVPTVVYRGEPFFGQDRIDVLTWRVLKDTAECFNSEAR
jgi:2-hydroxychromene-2-carboxylate isomerase